MTFLQLIAAAALAQSPSSLDARVEIQLIPITAQANTLQTEHLGSGGRISVRLNRYLGGYVSGFWNWHNAPSSAKDQIQESVIRVDVGVHEQLLSTWQVAAGLESIPFSGVFHIGETLAGEFGLVVRAGLGLGGVRARLKPLTIMRDGTENPPTWGDLGLRVIGDFGAGFRFNFGEFSV